MTMANYFQTTNFTTATLNATALTLLSGDTFFLAPTWTLSSTNGGNALTTAGSTQMEINGSVYGAKGILANGNTVSDVTNVTVGETGSISSYSSEAIDTQANSTLRLVNRGSITSYNDDAIDGAINARLEIWNYGTIQGRIFGIDAGFSGTDTLTLYNYGAIISGVNVSVYAGSGADVIYNTGEIFGPLGSAAVFLGSGADLFDSRGGSVDIQGSTGNDTIYGGVTADRLLGGSEDDTIYFSIEDAVVNGGVGTADRAINLYNDFGLTFDMGANAFEFYTGSAAGETIITTTATAIDVSAGGGSDLVQGNIGNDTLRGDDGNDSLEGNAGLDSLISGNGNDRLLGGDANDNLTGGAGFDNFAFNGALGGNDTITDFTIGVDKIEILRSGFLSPAVWSAGALDPARFQASANPSPINGVATFLLDNAGPGAGQLYWNDGNGGAIGIALIGLAPGQNLNFFTAADFVLV
jgi:Ca2+-binding RTX toxin-like protein